LQNAAEKLDCSVLINFLLDLAKDFNRFYRECPVLNAETEAFRTARLAMCLAIRDILKNGLNTLTIQVPEAM
jgi:arginyl-tRNA synthetase